MYETMERDNISLHEGLLHIYFWFFQSYSNTFAFKSNIFDPRIKMIYFTEVKDMFLFQIIYFILVTIKIIYCVVLKKLNV